MWVFPLGNFKGWEITLEVVVDNGTPEVVNGEKKYVGGVELVGNIPVEESVFADNLSGIPDGWRHVGPV